jgi:hypothetical protein
MASIKSDGDDENDYHNTSSGHQRLAVANVDSYDPARDFLPPRSYVRKRQLPVFHSPTNTGRTGAGREVDEGLAAYKAASDQLARGSTWQRGFNDRKALNSKVCTFATTWFLLDIHYTPWPSDKQKMFEFVLLSCTTNCVLYSLF